MERKLLNAVKRQLGGGPEALEMLSDVRVGGAGSGFPGFTYYTETNEFYRKNREAINVLVEEVADGLGENPAKMVAQFVCLGGNYSEKEVAKALYGRWNEEYFEIYNSLAWFALEESAYEIENREISY